ncbi:MAG: hypothetical protein ACK53L_28095, partial [Pirellulaceae bacterium]
HAGSRMKPCRSAAIPSAAQGDFVDTGDEVWFLGRRGRTNQPSDGYAGTGMTQEITAQSGVVIHGWDDT